MRFFDKILDSYNERKKEKYEAINERCDEYIRHFNYVLGSFDELLQPNTYVKRSDGTRWLDDCSDESYEVKNLNFIKYHKADNYDELVSLIQDFKYKSENYASIINKHNNQVTRTRIEHGYRIVREVEGYEPDRQQMEAIVRDVYNQLIIAGAGTGKTTTILGKIKYILENKMADPDEILALSFTNASATELAERVKKETGQELDVFTFYKLGLNIITKVNKIRPLISKLNMRSFIKEAIYKNLDDKEYAKKLVSVIIGDINSEEKNEFDFESEEEYRSYLIDNPPKTFKGEDVKSYGEVNIANFLLRNNVEYIYEHPYCVDTRDEEHSQYYPDFYLPKYDIYIEYFGINRSGQVPSYFKGGTAAYQNSMEWKRELHKEHKTKLIEVYAYENIEGILEQQLEKQLIANNVKLVLLTFDELLEKYRKNEQADILSGIIELMETVINLIKSNNYTINDVKNLNVGKFANKNEVLIDLIEPIFNEYLETLEKNGEIDFNDMINKASEYVAEGKFNHKYKYVIIDEFQDISKARYNLIKNLRIQNDFKLFAVGDDWQSIYRFAGSDIGYILNFEKYFGETEISKIETTYRFSKSMVLVSGYFITANPKQIKKNLYSEQDNDAFALGEVNGYNEENAIKNMIVRISELPKNSSVLFLGRYQFDADLLTKTGFLMHKYNNQAGQLELRYPPRPDLRMRFLTAHKSKGLQDDYVFIINNKAAKMGFPSKVVDHPLVNLLLEEDDDYPYSEERRLFYVALTRSRKKTFLVTLKNRESEFIKELKDAFGKELKNDYYICPNCGGRLFIKHGPYGNFFGCENYKNGCKFIRNINNKLKTNIVDQQIKNEH